MFDAFTNPLVYGYACARVRGWKSKLMTEKEFGMLIDAESFYTVIDVLSKTGYSSYLKKELIASGSEKLIAEIESILWSSLSKEFMSIFEMLSKRDQLVLRHMFKSYDSKNLRIVLVGRQKGTPLAKLFENILSIGVLDTSRLSAIYRSKNVKEFIACFKDTIYQKIVSEYFNSLMVSMKRQGKQFSLRDTNLLSDYDFVQTFCDAIENVIYGTLLPVIPSSTSSIRKVSRNIKMYVDGLNYIKMVEAKQEGKSFSSVNLFSCGTVPIIVLKRQYGKDDMQKWAAVFPEELMKSFKGVPDPVELERRLKIFQLQRMKALFGEESTTLGNIAGYMFLKLSEFHNVIAILKGKRMGLSKEQLRAFIV